MSYAVIAENVGFTEGPIFHTSGYVVFGSIDLGRIFRVKRGEKCELLAITGGGPNGMVEGKDGVIYVAQNGGTWPAFRWPGITGGIQVVRPGGRVEWLTQDPISPNDLCFGPDGFLYVTDPTRNGRRDDGRLWRIDPDTGDAELLASVSWYPNGIGFDRDADALYVASTGDQTIKRLPLPSAGTAKFETVIRLPTGGPDGFAFDSENNLIIAAVSTIDGEPGSIQTWSVAGELLDQVQPSEGGHVTNVALSRASELVITDSDRSRVLMVTDWHRPGLPLFPSRKATDEACASPTAT